MSVFNHQSWEKGRNGVCYVPAADVPTLRKSIQDYKQFNEKRCVCPVFFIDVTDV